MIDETKEITSIDFLRSLSSSPYEPEPPRKSLIVNLFMKLAKLFGKTGRATPHLYKGTNVSKVEWEYNAANAFFECIKDYADIHMLDNKTVLDVGCGWGGKMIYYAEHARLTSINGFDLPDAYSPEVSIAFAAQKKIPNCFFKTGYAETIPYEDDSFDVVLMEDVLEHVTNPEKVIEECYRVLKNGGLMILKFPSFTSMYGHHLDRALTFPFLHYFLSMKTWAAGLNYLRLSASDEFSYEPFDEVVFTKYRGAVTKNLNGLDFRNFKELIARSRFKRREIILMPYAGNSKKTILGSAYRFFFKVDSLKEILSNFVLFIGEKSG